MARRDCILIVDDSADTLEVLERNLVASGYDVLVAPGAEAAIEALDSTRVDVVITDLRMPRISGLDLVRHVRQNHKNTEILMITGYPTVEGAVEAVKTGALDFLSKPFTDEELLKAVRGALEKQKARRTLERGAQRRTATRFGLLGESDGMLGVFGRIERAVASTSPVLICGEPGTGKERIARAIHYGGARASGPFISVNPGAIPEDLAEAEFFGHDVPGGKHRHGLLRSAEGGTLFVDEIAGASRGLQARLVRFLDKKPASGGPPGARSKGAAARIIATTAKDLSALAKEGAFRDDLHLALTVLAIDVPPLRARGEDVLLLAHHVTALLAKEANRPVPVFSDRTIQVLRDYHWPGNVRELENVVQRLMVMCEADAIDVPDLPTIMRFSALRTKGLHRKLADVEADYIRSVLETVDGNRSRAADILGIDRKTLREKMKKADKPESS